jgi:hypothetical protein
MKSLYSLSAELTSLLQRVDEAPEGDVSEDVAAQEWMQSLIGSLEDQLEAKMDACAAIARSLQAEAKALKTEADFFKRRQKSVERHLAHLKTYMRDCIESLVEPDSKGKKRVKSKFHCYLQRNPLSVDRDLCDLSALDDRFVEYEPKILASEILAEIKATGVVPDGAALFPEEHSIRIR